MKITFSKLLAHYGMVVVLITLCGFFSAVTYTEQSLSGSAAIQQLADTVQRGQRAIIIGGATTGELASSVELRKQLEAKAVTVLEQVNGEPRTALLALQKHASTGGVDAIVCTEISARWLVFETIGEDLPSLATARIIKPQRYSYPNFLKADNLLNIANQIAVIAIVAIGMTMVIIAGGIDLAVGSFIALSAVLVSTFIRDYGGGPHATTLTLTACSLAAILLCGLLGGFSGLMVTRFDIPPFIVTLGMMLVASGLAYRIADGQSISAMPDSFVWLGRGADLLGLPNAVLLMFLLYGLAHILMSYTALGRHLYAVGGNREAAQISGIPIARTLLTTYIVSGLLAGLGGVIMTSQLKSGSPAYGVMYELYVIAAVVVGGTSLSGGKGRMVGTLIGAFTIAVIQNGMNLTNVESYTQKIVLGLVILGAVLLDRMRRRT